MPDIECRIDELESALTTADLPAGDWEIAVDRPPVYRGSSPELAHLALAMAVAETESRDASGDIHQVIRAARRLHVDSGYRTHVWPKVRITEDSTTIADVPAARPSRRRCRDGYVH